MPVSLRTDTGPTGRSKFNSNESGNAATKHGDKRSRFMLTPVCR